MTNSLLEFVHRDQEFVVVNKRSGMLAVPGKGPEKADCVVNRLRTLYPDCISHPAVHRLDMDTSGLMLLGLNQDVHRILSKQFEARQVRKHYIALLDGILDGERGTLELPFRLDVNNRPIQIYDEVHGKIGITHWEKIGIEEGRTRVAFTPLTGRTHQLRVHAAHPKGLGIPIVGDPFYGDGVGPGALKLHASELGFHHPRAGTWIELRCPPDF